MSAQAQLLTSAAGAQTTGDPAPDPSYTIALGIRCDECGGEGRIPTMRPRRGRSTRRCPVCLGEGELIERVTMREFRAVATTGIALGEDS